MADWGWTTEAEEPIGEYAIAGIGEAELSKASGRTARDIGAEAADRAIADAGLEPSDIDGLTYSGAFADFDEEAFHHHFGTDHELWVSRRGGGMTGAATAPYLAAKAIDAGKATRVLNVFSVAWATQRSEMTGGPGEVHARQSLKQNLEVPFGFFPQPVYFATVMRRHMIEYGTPRDAFGEIAVAFRANANRNPAALMADKPLDLDTYRAAPMLADPLCLYDSCLISDGGAAYVTTTVADARDLRRPVVRIAGVGEGNSAAGNHWSQQGDFTATPQVFSAPAAFSAAGVKPRDVDVVALYDPFTVVALMQLEDMGFCAKGEAPDLVADGALRHDGSLPTNTHGGLLSHAYVLGICHVTELVKQLRATAGEAQVDGAEVAVYGGYTGPQASTLVLTVDR